MSVEIIIPTYNNSSVHASVDYWNSYQLPVTVVDSSQSSDSRLLRLSNTSFNYKYYHMPSLPIHARLSFALSKSRAEFVALCPDDEVFLYPVFKALLDQIRSNSSLSTITGIPITFRYGASKGLSLYEYRPGCGLSWDSLSRHEACAEDRVSSFCRNYSPICYWGIHRRDSLVAANTLVEQFRPSLPHVETEEMLLQLALLIQGEVRIERLPFWLRNLQTLPIRKKNLLFNDWIQMPQFDDEITSVCLALSALDNEQSITHRAVKDGMHHIASLFSEFPEESFVPTVESRQQKLFGTLKTVTSNIMKRSTPGPIFKAALKSQLEAINLYDDSINSDLDNLAQFIRHV